MNTIHAIYENGVFRPTDHVELPENSEVELTIHPQLPVPAAPLRRLAEIAAKFPQNPDLPEDLAAQHDHYLYGTPKKL